MDLEKMVTKIIELSDDLYSSSPDYVCGYVQCQMDVVKLLRKELKHGKSGSTDIEKGVPCE